MESVKYVCPDCGKESKEPGRCNICQSPMVACCPTCGNQIVGEQIVLTDPEK